MELLKQENVQICPEAKDWRDAIRKSTKLLEEHGYVETRYKEEIISNLEKMGAYILVADHIALPHARPEQGAIRTQIGVTLFQKPVVFDNGSSAQLFVTLAAANADSHLEALMHISQLLDDENYVAQILASDNPEQLYQFFHQ